MSTDNVFWAQVVASWRVEMLLFALRRDPRTTFADAMAQVDAVMAWSIKPEQSMETMH